MPKLIGKLSLPEKGMIGNKNKQFSASIQTWYNHYKKFSIEEVPPRINYN